MTSWSFNTSLVKETSIEVYFDSFAEQNVLMYHNSWFCLTYHRICQASSDVQPLFWSLIKLSVKTHSNVNNNINNTSKKKETNKYRILSLDLICKEYEVYIYESWTLNNNLLLNMLVDYSFILIWDKHLSKGINQERV